MKIRTINVVHIEDLRGGHAFSWIDNVDFTWGDAVYTLVDPDDLIVAVRKSSDPEDWDDLLSDLEAARSKSILVAFNG